jgi:hypothetical protein
MAAAVTEIDDQPCSGKRALTPSGRMSFNRAYE